MTQLLSGDAVSGASLRLLAGAVLLATPVALGLARRRIIQGEARRPALFRAALDIGAVATIVVVLALTVVPDGYVYQPFGWRMNLVPFASIRQLLTTSVSPVVPARNIAGNLLLFAPLGFVLRLRHRGTRPLAYAVLAALLLSVGVETAQALLPLGRATDVDDVILNTIGAAVGGAIAAFLVLLTSRRSTQSAEAILCRD